MIGRFLGGGIDRTALLVLALIVGFGALVPALNLWTPEASPLHVPNYLVPLIGKYLTYGLLALAVGLIWGYAGILSLGHGAFFALGGYAMGMYLMRQIGTRGVYADPVLPDFMVFLNWKHLPWYWYGFDMFWFAALMVLVVPGVLAFVFGWFAFRSRVTGVYLSIITQAMTYALLLAFFRNDMGFGGNNGLTDFKDILGFNIQADSTRGALFFASALALALGYLICRAVVASQVRQGAGRRARRREPHALPRLPGGEVQALRLGALGLHGRRRRRALRAPGRHHQSGRVRARQFHRGGHLVRRRRPRHAGRADRRRPARQLRQDLVHRRLCPVLAVRAGRPLRRGHPVPAEGHCRHARGAATRGRHARPPAAEAPAPNPPPTTDMVEDTVPNPAE